MTSPNRPARRVSVVRIDIVTIFFFFIYNFRFGLRLLKVGLSPRLWLWLLNLWLSFFDLSRF
jgi:hypothetical protein